MFIISAASAVQKMTYRTSSSRHHLRWGSPCSRSQRVFRAIFGRMGPNRGLSSHTRVITAIDAFQIVGLTFDICEGLRRSNALAPPLLNFPKGCGVDCRGEAVRGVDWRGVPCLSTLVTSWWRAEELLCCCCFPPPDDDDAPWAGEKDMRRKCPRESTPLSMLRSALGMTDPTEA